MCVPLQTSLQFWPRCQGFGPERRKNSGLETAPIQNCKQTTFHKTFTHVKDKIYKNCTGPNFSARPSQENLSPWQPEHFAIDQLCSRAASEQP